MRSFLTQLSGVLGVALALSPVAGAAQWKQTEPMACPTGLLDYYVAVTARSGNSYMFITSWKLSSSYGVTQAFYDLYGASMFYTPSVTSTDGRAVWHYPGIYVKCEKITQYRPNGSIETVSPVFTTVMTEGDVEEKQVSGCCSGCGSGGGGGAGGITPDCTPTDGGGGMRIPMQRCTTTQTDYYWYYPDTGQTEYRYSETTTTCVAVE